jgi:RND family efflux transporter MFP subunit
MNRILLAVVVAVLFILLVAPGCGSGKQAAPSAAAAAAKPSEPLAVKVAPAEQKLTDRYLDVTGSLLPDESVNLSFEVPGRLAKVHFDFGQFVRKGDVVAELDQQEYKLQVERARAALKQALARIGLEEGENLAAARETPAMRQARAQLEDARSKYESAKKLVETGDIARDRFIEIEKAFEARRAAFEAARDDLRMQMATIEALQADLRLAEERLADTILRAPFDGSVSDKPVSPGAFVKDNNTIVTLVKSWPLRLRLDVPEVAAMGVRVGDTLRFTTEAVPGQEFTATVRQLNPSLDPRSRSLTAEARLNQADPRLKPGMFVQVRVTVSRQFPVTVVPKEAVYTVAGLTKVFAIRDGKARELRIEPGQTGDTWVEVPGGALQPGELVAVDKLYLLTDNQSVRPQ